MNKYKNIMSVLLFTLVLVILTSACGSGTTEMERYTDQASGFSVDYPAKWEVESGKAEVRFRENKDEASFYVSGETIEEWTRLLVPIPNVPLDLGHIEHNLKPYWPENSTGFSLGDPETVQVGNLEGIRFVTQGKKPPVLGHYGWLVMTISSNKVYLITATAQNKTSWDDYEPTFKAMLDSMEFSSP